jgi:DivIVA domain-containing protein
MKLSGHDIRMKEFRGAILRGYATDDVDTFLMHLAVDVDQRDRDLHDITTAHAQLGLDQEAGDRPATPNSVNGPDTNGAAPVASGFDETTIRAVVADIIDQARTAALEIRAEAQGCAAAVQEEAHQTADHVIANAKASAQRGLTKARERAQEILTTAHEQEQTAARLHAEAQLRLAHVDEQLASRAEALAAEARRLDDLAGWLAEQDLAPDPVADQMHQPHHAAPDVLELKPTAD